MRQDFSAATVHPRISRLACWAMLAAPLTMVAILAFARSAEALPTVPGVPTIPGVPSVNVPFEELEEDEGEGEEFEECDAEELAEEPEECEEEAEGAPSECLLRSAEAKAIAFTSQDKFGLTIRYTSLAPAEATVSYRLKGSKGSLSMAPSKQHLNEKGVIHVVAPLSATQADKARAASDLTVKLRIADTPGYCQGLTTLKLTGKRVLHGQLAWTRSSSTLSAG